MSFRSRREPTLSQGVGEGFLKRPVFELDMRVGVWERAGILGRGGVPRARSCYCL